MFQPDLNIAGWNVLGLNIADWTGHNSAGLNHR